MFRFAVAVFFVITTVSVAAQEIDVIAFGSCAREREQQPIWTEIIAKDPDLFLFIGDNHYADFWEKDGRIVMLPVPNIERILEAYDGLAAQPGYRRMQRQCPIMATWDDHDYGANDAGNDFYLRKESQIAFLDFYGFGKNSRTRQQEGIYHSRIFGAAGRRVQIIMLDTRYNRDPLEFKSERVPGRGPYQPTEDSTKTILGEQQWKWLEMELRQDAEIRIIASSIQIVADEHGYETWGNFPAERKRLYDLITKTHANGVVFISGDRHLMEISRDTQRGNPPYPMWDFTSSGLNQRPEVVNDPNQFRVGPVSREPNFGIIHIEWGTNSQATKINLEGAGDHGQMLTRQTLFLNELGPK